MASPKWCQWRNNHFKRHLYWFGHRRNVFLYIVDQGRYEVRRYRIGENEGTVVAGANGQGNRLDQFSVPSYVFVDRHHSMYVSDWKNHRVMKWE
ncbi:unnamed protein product [Rotaria socialis]|uniref:NHL repeat-containing protein n=1 Tax=Rotaria socialis TaxID=392032 RepID=A0A821BG70_9BILA|nr:unnamed protein product [Rotaria socialis]CAF3464290.1 unnamed protein product [Rotaria socialis]CAF3542507.1 unnamed protein product [Rotaria socialis]CAF3571988.1 unnamed protein product [Rotaria socialis]CAF4498163.1 unnamed protein product [Rotaria socialis]